MGSVEATGSNGAGTRPPHQWRGKYDGSVGFASSDGPSNKASETRAHARDP